VRSGGVGVNEDPDHEMRDRSCRAYDQAMRVIMFLVQVIGPNKEQKGFSLKLAAREVVIEIARCANPAILITVVELFQDALGEGMGISQQHPQIPMAANQRNLRDR
jgi:hypothetical protein